MRMSQRWHPLQHPRQDAQSLSKLALSHSPSRMLAHVYNQLHMMACLDPAASRLTRLCLEGLRCMRSSSHTRPSGDKDVFKRLPPRMPLAVWRLWVWAVVSAGLSFPDEELPLDSFNDFRFQQMRSSTARLACPANRLPHITPPQNSGHAWHASFWAAGLISKAWFCLDTAKLCQFKAVCGAG